MPQPEFSARARKHAATERASAISELADSYAHNKALMDALKARQEAIKDALIATKLDVIVGKNYTIKVSRFACMRLVGKLVKGILTPAQIAACSKSSDEVKLSVKRNLPDLFD